MITDTSEDRLTNVIGHGHRLAENLYYVISKSVLHQKDSAHCTVYIYIHDYCSLHKEISQINISQYCFIFNLGLLFATFVVKDYKCCRINHVKICPNKNCFSNNIDNGPVRLDKIYLFSIYNETITI